MIVGGVVGVAIVRCVGILKWKEGDDVIITGMWTLVVVGSMMIGGEGFGGVIEGTNEVGGVVEGWVEWIGNSEGVGGFLMLVMGVVIRLGIGWCL